MRCRLGAPKRSHLLVWLLLTLTACSGPSVPTLAPALSGKQLVWPVSGWISATDYYGTGKYHELGSADVAAPYWSPVGAARGGTVAQAGWSLSPRLGYYVRVKHGSEYETLYAHLVRSPSVKVGDVVGTNQTLGYSGRTGNAGNPHLHFAILRYGDELKIPEIDFGSWVNKGSFVPGDYIGLSALSSRTALFSVRVVKDKLPVYSSASTDSVRGTLAVNTTWTVKGGGKGFYAVTYDGTTGYIVNSGVVPSRSNIFGVRTTVAVSARSGPGGGYLVQTTFPADTVLTVFESKNSFYRTQWKDQNSFVQYVWIPIGAATPTSRFWMRAALATQVQVRSGPGTSNAVVQTLNFNAYAPEYIVLETIKGWYKIGTGRWFPGWQTLRR